MVNKIPFTPAPWERNGLYVSWKGHPVCTFTDEYANWKFNAQLVSKAPDMYALLTELHRTLAVLDPALYPQVVKIEKLLHEIEYE